MSESHDSALLNVRDVATLAEVQGDIVTRSHTHVSLCSSSVASWFDGVMKNCLEHGTLVEQLRWWQSDYIVCAMVACFFSVAVGWLASVECLAGVICSNLVRRGVCNVGTA